MTAGVVDVEVVGGTARRVGSGTRQAFTDGTVGIGVGSALSAAFAPPVVTTFVTDARDGQWWFVGLALAGFGSILFGVWQRRRMRLRSSAGVIAVVDDAAGESDRLRQDRRQAIHQLDRECSVAVAVTGTVPGPEPGAMVTTVDRAASQVVQALAIAQQVAADLPSIRLVPMMRMHMAFRFGARLGHTFARELVLMDKRQEGGTVSYFPAVRLRAGDPAGSVLDVSYEDLDGADPDRAALAIDLQGFGRDFRGPVRAACQQYGYGKLMLLVSRTVRLDTGKDLAYQPIVDEICHAWRHGELPEVVNNNERGIFLTGPPSIAVALGARLARTAFGLWTPYQYVSLAPGEGGYQPLVPPVRSRP